MKLVRDAATGLWREVPMKHKKHREAKPVKSTPVSKPDGGAV
jgi:hypothetical protein